MEHGIPLSVSFGRWLGLISDQVVLGRISKERISEYTAGAEAAYKMLLEEE